MENIIPLLIIIGSVQLVVTIIILIMIYGSFKRRMATLEKKMIGSDAEKIKEHQQKIERIYSRINQNYFKVEKNQADLVEEIKHFTESSKDYSSTQNHIASTQNELHLIGMKVDDLLKGMNSSKNGEDYPYDSEMNAIKNSLFRIEKDIHTMGKRGQSPSTTNEFEMNIDQKIQDIYEMMRHMQSNHKSESEEIKKDLAHISTQVSPLQSKVMNVFSESIEELRDLRNDLIKSGNHLLIQESLDALSEYINLSQKQLFKVLSYHNEKLNNVDDHIDKSLEKLEGQLKVSENKLVNYLSYVYQSANSKTNTNSIDYSIIAKIEELKKKLDTNTGESRKYFSTIYNKLNNPREKAQ